MNPPENSKIVSLNWQDNPWFPDVLEQTRLEDKVKREETYGHIWEGQFLIYTEGSYFGLEMRRIQDEKRICEVAYDRAKGVVTASD